MTTVEPPPDLALTHPFLGGKDIADEAAEALRESPAGKRVVTRLVKEMCPLLDPASFYCFRPSGAGQRRPPDDAACYEVGCQYEEGEPHPDLRNALKEQTYDPVDVEHGSDEHLAYKALKRDGDYDDRHQHRDNETDPAP
jgi:hypothetical protein